MGNRKGKKSKKRAVTRCADQDEVEDQNIEVQNKPIAARTRSKGQEAPVGDDYNGNFEDNEIGPNDSASQVSRKSDKANSYVSSCVKIEMEALAERQALEREELEIKQRKEALELRVRQAKATAMNGSCSGTNRRPADASPLRQGSSRLGNPVEPPARRKRPSELDPTADEFYPDRLADLEIEEDKPKMLMFLEEGQRQQRQLLDAVQLPKTEIIKFDGNPIKYWTFVNSFEANVENVTNDNAARLSRLLYYCEGKARNIIEPCAMMPPSEGYQRAKKLLRERFGDPFTVTECWVKKITVNGATVQREGMQDFADELRSCYECLKAVGCTAEIDSQRTLLRIAERLPSYLKSRWVREVRNIKGKDFRVPTAEDLVKFIEEASAEATDPVFGSLFGANKQERRSSNTRSFSTVTHKDKSGTEKTNEEEATPQTGERERGPVRSACLFCADTHSPFACPVFKGMKVFDRIKAAKDKNLCFNCLRRGHSASNCRVERTCSIEGCGQKHTKFLHPVDSRSKENIDDGQKSNVGASCHATGAGIEVMLPIVPIRVRSGPGKEWTLTHALLDNGSTATFCSNKLRQAIGIEGKVCDMKVTTVHGTQEQRTTMIEQLQVSSVDGTLNTELRDVYSMTRLPISPNHMATAKDIDEYTHLKPLKLPRSKPEEVEVLIGQDNCDIMMPLEVKCGEPGEPYAIRTPLGWSLNGPVSKEASHNAVVNFLQCEDPETLDRQLHKFWKVEDEPLLHDTRVGQSVADKRALEVWEKTAQRLTNGHYQASIPFRRRPPQLPDNRSAVERRLEGLQRRLKKDPVLHEAYKQEMDKLFREGYAEPITEERQNEQMHSAVWYVPHHPVFNPRKPKKCRVVFDCAAEHQQVSLNKEVLQGPDLMNNLVGVLTRFRQEAVAFTGDIKAMFNQVFVTPEDRDVLRFLWWPDGDLSREVREYRMKTHLFGGTWSPACCIFFMRQTARDNEEEFDMETIDTVLRNFYVDDCVKSVASEEAATKLISQLKCLLQKGGFQLGKWASNSSKVSEFAKRLDHDTDINENEANQITELPGDDKQGYGQRTLGVTWDPSDDNLGFAITVKPQPVTRRQLLSLVSSLYDPLGIVTPFVLSARLVMQDLTRMKLGWDDLLPETQRNIATKWVRELEDLKNVKVPRCLKLQADKVGVNSCQLHIFADSSERALGAVAYLRCTDKAGRTYVNFVMSRQRLAPLKTMTIPRLELSAATMAARLGQFLQREIDLNVDDVIFWTDSSVVLNYINNDDKRFQTFVANRLATIRGLTSVEQWRHVPSKDNPADIISRGCSVPDLTADERWLQGASFLKENMDKWPSRPEVQAVMDDDTEVKSDTKVTQYATSLDEIGVIERLAQRCSSWYKVKLLVAWWLRVKAWLKDKKNGKQEALNMQSIKAQEMRLAEVAAIRCLQKNVFSEELRMLENEGTVKKASRIHQLLPFIGPDGLLRVGGRLVNASLPYNSKHQIILPKHQVTELLVRDIHSNWGHVGAEHVLALSRQQYWILSGRQIIRRQLRQCVRCRRDKAQPAEQLMADLPEDRTGSNGPAFHHVGVDCFGPFVIKQGRSQQKRYGCIFTCLSIRAVHIEVLHSLDTDSFINALRRFMSRRGHPKLLRSDNGTNFVGAERELKRVCQDMDHDRISGFLRKWDVQWLFNTPQASHHGGVWERLIRSTRKILTSVSNEQILTDESLVTLMCEVEAIINSRPLTTVSQDATDPEPLTPNHLLLLQQNVDQLGHAFDHKDGYRRRWRQVQLMANAFWRRWTREYLPILQSRAKWTKKAVNLKLGDIVLMITDTPRGQWPLAKVVGVKEGKGGIVRSIKVFSKGTVLERPVTKVCLLEAV